MISLYIIAAVVGGALVALSAFGAGDHDHDHDHEAHLDQDAEIDHDGDHEVHALANIEHDATWLPFLSLRFWTYFSAFFGLTGLGLTYLTDLAAPIGALLSAGTGVGSGLGISYAMRRLRASETHSGSSSEDLIGSEGTVLLTVRKDDPGKVRCRIKGELIDVLAVSEEENEIERGAEVIVVGFEDDRASVLRRTDLLENAG